MEDLKARWVALAQSMKLRGEWMYPTWHWDLYIGDSGYIGWACDMPSIVALKAGQILEEEMGESKLGIIIDISQGFSEDCLLLSTEAREIVIEGVLHSAIESAILIAPGCFYPTFQAVAEEGKW